MTQATSLGFHFPHLSHAELGFFDGKALSSSNISESKTARAQRRERKLEGERKTRKRIVWQGKAERLQEWTQSLQMLAEETKMAGPLS